MGEGRRFSLLSRQKTPTREASLKPDSAEKKRRKICKQESYHRQERLRVLWCIQCGLRGDGKRASKELNWNCEADCSQSKLLKIDSWDPNSKEAVL